MSEQKLRAALERIELCLSQGDQSGARRIVSEALAGQNGQRDPSEAAWVDAFDAINAGKPAVGAPDAPKLAYHETHEPPHCPTCGCGLEAPGIRAGWMVGELYAPGDNPGQDVWSATIHVGRHGDAIECHGDTKAIVEGLRNSVMRAAVPDELTPQQVASACLSYRHDFGLLTLTQQRHVANQCREWWRAVTKELEQPSQHPLVLAASPEPTR